MSKWLATAAIIAAAALFAAAMRTKTEVSSTPLVAASGGAGVRPGAAAELTMADVLRIAADVRAGMTTLTDYTATFVSQQRDGDVLGEVTRMNVRIHPVTRNKTDDAPMRVYLRFDAPEENRGREVLWGQDLYEGQMAVHEVGMILGLKTIWLDPYGMLAMAGQRYAISEIGLVKLVERLIERGQQDLSDPDVTAEIRENESFDGRPAKKLIVTRAQPSGKDDDFSRAEVIVDRERNLIVSYTSFGWPDQAGDDPPLIESFSYRDLKTDVGLTDADFDVTNPDYSFPGY